MSEGIFDRDSAVCQTEDPYAQDWPLEVSFHTLTEHRS